MSSKNRKVYLMGKMSVREFFSAPTRFLAQSISKESEFEKPYLDDDRAKMHLDLPEADWPPFPPLPPWPPLPEAEGPIPKLSWCGITCDEPSDCDEPIWCRPWVWCGHDLQCNLCSWIVTGDTIGYTPHPMYGGTKGIDIWIDSSLADEEGKVFIHAQMKDPCENLCGADVELTCKVCPPDVVISWDTDLSPETIAADSSEAVYVKDGLGPYSWSVTGTGFSMLHASTSGVANTLVADGSACGVATITVTDYCEDSTGRKIRCTTGTWVTIDVGTAISPGCDNSQAPTAEQCGYTNPLYESEDRRWQCNGITSYRDGSCNTYYWNDLDIAGCLDPPCEPETCVWDNWPGHVCYCTQILCREWQC